MDRKLGRRPGLPLALWADEVTLGGPGFPTNRGDLTLSGLTTCTVVVEHTYPCELSSSAPGLNHSFSFLPNAVLTLSLCIYQHFLMEHLFVPVAGEGGVWIKWKEFEERAPFLPEQ